MQITVERYGHPDLAGAMLRKSFSRSPVRAAYWAPGKSVFFALISAGVWPAALLLYRLWLYGSFQRFRAGELAKWAEQRAGSSGAPYARLVRLVRPTAEITLGIFCIWIALACGFWLAAWFTLARFDVVASFPVDPRRCLPAMVFVIAIFLASIFQMLAVIKLRLRVEQLIERLNVWGIHVSRKTVDPNLPRFVLWPIGLLLLGLPSILLHWRWMAFWQIAVAASVLAAEVQRGYITVADRRMRLAVARAIGRILYGPGRKP